MRMARNRWVQELHERRGIALGIVQESKKKKKEKLNSNFVNLSHFLSNIVILSRKSQFTLIYF